MQQTDYPFKQKFFVSRSVMDYYDFALDYLFSCPDILEHPFYKKVMLFILAEKAPLFFVAQNEGERMAFTTPYNIIPIPRAMGRYGNTAVFSLTNLHEFIHALFGYPRKISQTTTDQFDEDMMIREAAASNATEVLIYYDIPSLRDQVQKIFPEIWFDILYHQMRRCARPNVAQLLRLRRDWLTSDAYDWLYCAGSDHPVAEFMSKWRNGNEIYWHKRLKKLHALPELKGFISRSLSPTFYEEELADYQPRALRQDNYERLQLHHVSVLYALSGNPDKAPRNFPELLNHRDELDTLEIALK